MRNSSRIAKANRSKSIIRGNARKSTANVQQISRTHYQNLNNRACLVFALNLPILFRSTLCICLLLSIHTLSQTIHFLMIYNKRCLIQSNIQVASLYAVTYNSHKAWETANMLKLNDKKTELMLVTSKRANYLHSLPTSTTIANAQIPFKQ